MYWYRGGDEAGGWYNESSPPSSPDACGGLSPKWDR
jgi:hypothetical protein